MPMSPALGVGFGSHQMNAGCDEADAGSWSGRGSPRGDPADDAAPRPQ